jgi:hypothetical protein
MADDVVGALEIKNRLKKAAAAITSNKYVKQAASVVAPGILNDTKNAALKKLEQVAPGTGSQVQSYVLAKETEYKNRIVSGMVITGVCAVVASYLLLKRKV